MLNSKMVILSAEICKLRGKKNADKAKVSELCEIIDWMIPEYKRLWLSQNYEKGVEVFIEHLKMHKRDLLKMQN